MRAGDKRDSQDAGLPNQILKSWLRPSSSTHAARRMRAMLVLRVFASKLLYYRCWSTKYLNIWRCNAGIAFAEHWICFFSEGKLFFSVNRWRGSSRRDLFLHLRFIFWYYSAWFLDRQLPAITDMINSIKCWAFILCLFLRNIANPEAGVIVIQNIYAKTLPVWFVPLPYVCTKFFIQHSVQLQLRYFWQADDNF